MEMHQVRYFLAVAEHLNFTRAAERLHVAQPSLTRAIQKLEEELSGPLFRRERSKTHLTELGRMMLPHLAASLEAAEAAKRQARSFHQREAGQLAIGICDTVPAAIVAAHLAATVEEIAGLELSVEVAPAEAVEERLTAGAVDAAVLPVGGVWPDRFDHRILSEHSFAVAFGEAHRFAGRSAISLDALDGEPLVARSGPGYEDRLAAAMEARGLQRVVRHRAGTEAWANALVRLGLGCRVLPEPLAAASGLKSLPLEDVVARHGVALVTVAGRRHSPALAFLVRRVSAAT